MRRRTLGLALSAILSPTLSYALGLGEISTNSALNQPLNAEIEMVSTSPGEVGSVTVKLAPDAVFDQVGINRSPVLDKLNFKPTVENGQPVIKVTSDAPIQEPFVNFIVEVSWPKGKLLREYTVLLDPPVLGGAPAAPAVTEPAPVVTQAEPTPMELEPGGEGLAPFVAGTEAEVTATEPPEIAASAQGQEEEIPLAETYPVESTTKVAAEAPTVDVETYPVDEGLPPFLTAGASVAEAAPANGSDIQTYEVATPVSEAEGTSEIFVTPPTGTTTAAASDAAGYYDGDSYRVNKGDNLFRIAKQVQPGAGVNIHQVMVALLKDNPKAFVNGDMNRIKAGYILRVPDPETMASISKREAKAMVLAATQGGAYAKYKEKVTAEGVPQAAADTGTQVAGLADLDQRVKQAAAQGAESAEGAPEKGLEILVPKGEGSAAGGAETGSEAGAASEDITFLREKLASAEQENVELRSRVSELETLLEAKNRLIELKDEQLADLQEQLGGVPLKQPETTPMAEEPAQASSEAAAPSQPAEGTKGLLVEEQPPATSEAPAETAQTQPAESEKTAEATAPEAAAPGLIENIKNNPNLLMGAGAGVLLLSALAWLLFRRKDEEQLKPEAAEEAPEVTQTPEIAHLMDEQPEGEVEIETPEEEKLDLTAEISEEEVKKAAESAPLESELEASGLGADEGLNEDEVLSEANVYLAYGLQDQAIDLLKPAVEAHPERADYLAKLAEAYHAAGDKESFLATAAKLNQQVTPENEGLWHRVAVLGKDIAPDDELFVNADTGGLTMTAIRPKPEEMMDLDEEDQTMAMAGEDVAQVGNDAAEALSPDDTQLPDLDELSKSLQIEEDDAIKALQNEAADLDLNFGESGEDQTMVQDSGPDVGELDALAESGLQDLKSGVDESVAEFDSKTLGLDLTSAGEDFSLSDMDEELTSMTTGADEISTKLDLAKAYIDMGDDEGAREALEEVISQGNDEQQGAAKQLLEQLS